MARFNFIWQIKEQVESWVQGFGGGRSMQPSSESTPQRIFTDEITVEMKEAARLATDFETHMRKSATIKAWLPGVCFAMCMSLACIMEGYGLVLIAGFFASPRFKTDFGCPVTPGQDFDCEIPTEWQTGLVDGALGGQVIGIVLNGWLTEKYGYRRTFLGATVAITAFFSITFFANSLWVLLIGLILCGIPWGIFQTLTTSYASDVCPTPIRAYFTMWTNLCWVLGQLMGASIQRGLVSTTSEWNYKIPFLLQWAFPLPIIIAAFAAPESPWWLIRQGRHKDVYAAIEKLQRKKAVPQGYSMDNHVTMLFVTNKEEEANAANGGGKMGYMDCFKGVNCRRTINTCAVWSIQNACGAALMQFSTYFFLQAGLPSKWAFTCTMVQVSAPPPFHDQCVPSYFTYYVLF
jgi:MFS transporter, SP family, general alpha glucoside:H+ symporter